MESTIITLLTITVILLSAVVIALLIAATLVMVKVNKVAKTIDQITDNLASATAWLAPAKIVSEIMKAFRK